MKLIRFTEENDWEGETWHFYMWVSETAEEKLRKILSEMAHSDPYSISGKDFSPKDVEKLTSGSEDDDGYMPRHNFEGVLDEEKLVLKSKDCDPFYKGGIGNFCNPCQLDSYE